MGEKKKEKKLSKNETEISNLKKEKDEFKNIAARAQADLVNYRNRMRLELAELETRGKKTISIKVLSVIDDIDLALENVNGNASAKSILEGISSIREKFRSIFESENITEIIEADNFNPIYHEALITTETKDYKPGSIIRILRKGYIMNGNVIRPSQVEIAKEKNDIKESKEK